MSQKTKRDFLKLSTGALAGLGLGGCGDSEAAPALLAPLLPFSKPAFVLVHGAWEGAWAWERVAALLVAGGYPVLARDLPGHGLNASPPASFQHRPLDYTAFATEPSAVAGTTLENYVGSILASIDQLRAQGSSKVILVGHSLSGAAISAVAERAPEKISRLVYLAGSMPKSGVPAVAYFQAPENQGELIGQQLMADPNAVGALRVDFRSEDPGYRANSKLARYGELSTARYDAVASLLSCDEPVGPLATPIATTTARWGSLPRYYIKCLQDRAIMPALQQRFIAEADAATPLNKTRVQELNACHTPQLSQPDAVASLLMRIAG